MKPRASPVPDATHLEAITLRVAEVDEILRSLRDARVLKRLSDRRRQQLAEAYTEIAEVRERAVDNLVVLSA